MATTPIKGRDYKTYETMAANTKSATITKPYTKDVNVPQAESSEDTYTGKEALFNRFYTFFLSDGKSPTSINYFADDSGWNPRNVLRNPTAASLIEWSRNSGTNCVEYSWEDFLWCKNYGKVPNNYMITLRRFGSPAQDNLLNANRMGTPDIGRLITWMDGESNKMEDMLKFSVKLNWKEFKSEIQTINAQKQGGAGSGSMIGKIMGATDTAGSKTALKGKGNSNFDPYTNQTNKILGPINVIDAMMVRERGLKFEQSLKCVFEYEMKSIDGINGKVAFLDLLMNVLMVTYNRGDFWGGAIRYTGGKLASNPLAGQEGMKALANGDFGGFLEGLTTGLSSRVNDLTGGKGLSLDGIGNALKSVGGNIASRVAGESMESMGRPQAQATNALLTGEDTGEWHLMLGNPARPMMSLGNLILEGTDVEFSGPLGIDDFPTKMKVTCTLKPARSRDRDDVQMMFAPDNKERLYGSAIDFVKTTYYGQVGPDLGGGSGTDYSGTQNVSASIASTPQQQMEEQSNNLTDILAQRFPNHHSQGSGNVENVSKWTT